MVSGSLLMININCRLTTSVPKRNWCIATTQICDEKNDCSLKDDENRELCNGTLNFAGECDKLLWNGHLASFIICDLDDVYKRLMWGVGNNYAPHFSLANYSIHPSKINVASLISKVALKENVAEDETLMTYSRHQAISVPFHCHGGILVNILRNGSTDLSSRNEGRCLCPPAFYGIQCEYQNQRVTVTLQIGTLDGQTPVSLIAYLFDDKYHLVQSFHRINYVSIRDCGTKFGFHLLYSSRPKAADSNYFVRIDAFEMKTLDYRASWKFPVVYSFLPVYRLSILLTIPIQPLTSEALCPLKCSSGHGQCTIYANTGQFFCRCKPGWFGPLCTNSYKCDCSPDSICTGSWNNRSICVCPLQKFGPRCYLTNNVCEQQKIRKCRHNGQCIPSDVRITSDSTTTCICPVEFYGTNCEFNQSQIDISFQLLSTQNIASYILLHFIKVRTHPSPINYLLPAKEWGPHERLSTFKKIPVDRVSITVYWSSDFHLLFGEYQGNMYLLILQTKYRPSISYNVTIEPSQRCPPIRELLNNTIISFPVLRRVKYYHIPCQKRLELSCFHDEDQFMCLCTHDRRANCFSFDYHMRYNCSYISYCENGGQCFQNSVTCPSAAICACPSCYFGTRCHLSTKGFGLPLDVILGYQIWPNIAFTKQPLTLRMSLLVTVIMLVLGIMNGILSIPTFQRKKLREFGCGVYLYIASIISLLTMITFTLKFVLLVLTQLLIITSRTVLIGQCVSVDLLLKVFLQTGDWLYACVAVERLFSVIKGVGFNKSLSKKVAKWIISFVLIFVIGTSIHEAYYRSLIDDVEEQRTWCIVRYPKSYLNSLTMYTTIMSIIHFMGPFVINIVSAVGIITIAARHRMKADKKRSYRSHLRIQIRQHKYLIISPIVLILLGLPRIILAFTLECMKSARDPVTLFLVGYFVSFIPSVLTFVVFVLPSETYTKAFKASMQSLRAYLYCRRVNY
jgi:hypothetical protein